LLNPEKPEKTRIFHLAAVILAMLLWSTAFAASKKAYLTIPPLTLGAGRSLVATLGLFLVALALGQLRLPRRQDLFLLVLSGILGVTCNFVLQNIAISLTSASEGVMICATFPLITVILERLVHGVGVSPGKAIGIGLAIIGVAVITGLHNLGEENNWRLLGDLLLMLNGIAWTFYSFLTRRFIKVYSPISLTFFQTAAGTIFLLPLTCLEVSQWQAPSATAIGITIFLGLFCSVGGYLAYNFGLERLSTGTAVSLFNLMPVFGVLFAVLTLREDIDLIQLAGGVIVMVGVFLSVCGKNTPEETAEKVT
jgi:drug/metabolite transporter (DMT)-like permease